MTWSLTAPFSTWRRANPAMSHSSLAFHGFTIRHVGGSGPASFNATLSNPEPPGEITTAGNFGPWNAVDVGETAVSGNYRFEHADLGVFPGIDGILVSSGKYAGTLRHLPG